MDCQIHGQYIGPWCAECSADSATAMAHDWEREREVEPEAIALRDFLSKVWKP